MDLSNYKKNLTSGSWSTKDPKDAQIFDLVGVSEKLMGDKNILQEQQGLQLIHQGRAIIHQGPPLLDVGQFQGG